MDENITPREYNKFLLEIKERVRNAQLSAMKAVNKELVSLYWDLGKMIVEKQEQHQWGTSIVENLAKDLQNEFQGSKRILRSKLVEYAKILHHLQSQ